jgi:hypothetical protein
MNENQNAEFAWFKRVQGKLRDAFLKEGYDNFEAQELGFLVAQAVRDVPALLHLLEEAGSHSNDEILDAVHAVLSNRFAMNEAARKLSLES